MSCSDRSTLRKSTAWVRPSRACRAPNHFTYWDSILRAFRPKKVLFKRNDKTFLLKKIFWLRPWCVVRRHFGRLEDSGEIRTRTMFRSGLSEWQRTNACGISSQESAAAVVVAAAAANFLVTPSARWSKCTLNFVDQSNSNHLCSNWTKTWQCRGVRTISTLCVAGWRPWSSDGLQKSKSTETTTANTWWLNVLGQASSRIFLPLTNGISSTRTTRRTTCRPPLAKAFGWTSRITMNCLSKVHRARISTCVVNTVCDHSKKLRPRYGTRLELRNLCWFNLITKMFLIKRKLKGQFQKIQARPLCSSWKSETLPMREAKKNMY